MRFRRDSQRNNNCFNRFNTFFSDSAIGTAKLISFSRIYLFSSFFFLSFPMFLLSFFGFLITILVSQTSTIDHKNWLIFARCNSSSTHTSRTHRMKFDNQVTLSLTRSALSVCLCGSVALCPFDFLSLARCFTNRFRCSHSLTLCNNMKFTFMFHRTSSVYLFWSIAIHCKWNEWKTSPHTHTYTRSQTHQNANGAKMMYSNQMKTTKPKKIRRRKWKLRWNKLWISIRICALAFSLLRCTVARSSRVVKTCAFCIERKNDWLINEVYYALARSAHDST